MAKFAKGDKRPPNAGRKKGTPNKKDLMLQERALALGVDPFEVLLMFSKGDWKALGYEAEKYIASRTQQGDVYRYTIDPSVRAKCAGDACKYLYSQKRATEISGPGGENLDVNVSVDLKAVQAFENEIIARKNQDD